VKYTLFTPTYNRAHLLTTLFDSLEIQQFKNFEWLIVDDGSTDNTEDVVKKLEAKASFPVRYLKQENGGKHTAFNTAIEHADSEWFVCIDSDDPLTPDSLVNMERACAEINDDAAGFVGVCISPDGSLLEKHIHKHFYSDTIDIRDKYHLWGEPEVYRLNILKNYRFPVFKGERFVTEAILFDELTSHKKLLYTNFPMQVKEYLPGGLTDNQTKIRIQSPNGTLAYYKLRYHLSRKFWYKIKALINYNRFLIHARKNHSTLVFPVLKISYIVYPLSLFLYYKDLKQK
jgi:glycosyltransferase involved in cell wall biosynthesis